MFLKDQSRTDLQQGVTSLVPSTQEKNSSDSQAHSVSNQFLMAADKARSALVAENEYLKIRLGASEKQITNLEEQIDKMTTSQTEVLKFVCFSFEFVVSEKSLFLKVVEKVNYLLTERETLRDEMKVLQAQISTTEDQVKEKKRQCEETTSLLEETEQRLKTALDSVNSLEGLLQSSDERLGSLQTQLQQSSTERAIVNIYFSITISCLLC